VRFLTALATLSLLAVSGCSSGEGGMVSATGSGASSASAESGAGGGLSTGIGGGPTFATGASGGGAPGDCSEAAKLVYVLTSDGDLFSFHPPTLDFIQVGTLACPDVPCSSCVFSMSVARDGTAYVLFGDGNLQLVSTADGSCKSSGYLPDQLGFETFGMGFSSEGPDSEALFAADFGGAGLARMDPKTLTMTLVGGFDGLEGAAELSGTGDGRLFGFFKAGARLAEIEKASAEVLSVVPLPLTVGSAWAFAFWGGDLWLFTSPGQSSEVHRYRPSTGKTDLMGKPPAMKIVGAGVSTCAPLEPPA
jgi:hypothetical protein